MGFEKGSEVFGLLCHKESAYFVTESTGFEKGSEVLGLLCHKEYKSAREKKPTTWLTLSQRVMGSKREANHLAYFVTKSNGFEKGSQLLSLLSHKE